MRLSAPNGDYVEINVAGYQFPELAHEPYDSNWLVIEGAASIQGRAWRFRDPSLLTYELARLAAWFDAQAKKSRFELEISFLEPNLSFQRIGDSVRVFFALESRPPWGQQGDDWKKHFVEAPAEPAALGAAAGSLLADLRSFPQRADR